MRWKDKLIFPIGDFDTYLCTASLRRAIERDEVTQVYSALCYSMGDIFSPFIDYFYEQRMISRDHGNKIADRTAKLLMNSLYGKWSMKIGNEVSNTAIDFDGAYRESIYDDVTGKTMTVTRLFNREIITDGESLAKSSILSIPAHVTDYARMLLWEIIEGVGTEHVLYCDTDSIKVRRSDMPRVKHSFDADALGALKVEGEYDSLIVHGLKDYEMDGKIKIKGVPSRATRDENGDYHYQQFHRQASHLREGRWNAVVVSDVVKHLKRIYTKGRVTSDGTVHPWRFPDDEAYLSVLHRRLTSSHFEGAPQGSPQ
jgi:hypothetical protein